MRLIANIHSVESVYHSWATTLDQGIKILYRIRLW